MNKYNNKLEGAIDDLLDRLCVEWGFCIPPDEAIKIMSCKKLVAEDFANMVLEAEGLGSDSAWRKKIKHKFIEKFGNEISVETYEGLRSRL